MSLYPKDFHSLTDRIFLFNFRLWLSGPLYRTIDSVLNHILLTLASDHDEQKNQNLLTKFFAKNKSSESTDHETGLPDAASPEVSIENTNEGSKAESVNFKMSGSRRFCGSFMIPVTTLYLKIFAERQAQIIKLY